MKSIMEENETNVIEVSFSNDEEVTFPSSKNYPLENESDPLNDLLDEFSHLEFEHALDDKKEDFIFHHQKRWNFNVSILDSTEEMVQTITKQTKRLREDVKRLKYYLDEMNLDD